MWQLEQRQLAPAKCRGTLHPQESPPGLVFNITAWSPAGGRPGKKDRARIPTTYSANNGPPDIVPACARPRMPVNWIRGA